MEFETTAEGRRIIPALYGSNKAVRDRKVERILYAVALRDEGLKLREIAVLLGGVSMERARQCVSQGRWHLGREARRQQREGE